MRLAKMKWLQLLNMSRLSMTSLLRINPTFRIWISFFIAKRINFLNAIFRMDTYLLHRCELYIGYSFRISRYCGYPKTQSPYLKY